MKQIHVSKYKFCGSKFSDLVKNWMIKVEALEVHIEGKLVHVLMRKNKNDYKIFMEGWLNGEISTSKFKEFLEDRYWWVLFPLEVFEDRIYNT